jgi:hypothetical protein
MHEGDAFVNLGKIYRRFRSLGLNLSYDGLLLGMWAEGPIRFPQLSLTTCLGLRKYELMTSSSFLMMLFHRRTEVQSTTKASVDRHARGCQVEDDARGLADVEGPIHAGGR